MIVKVVGNNYYNEQLFQYLKNIYYDLISMLTFSHDCFNSGNWFDIIILSIQDTSLYQVLINFIEPKAK